MDRETGRPRGLAFAEISNSNEAANAIKEPNLREIGGRAITVSEAWPKTDRPCQGDHVGHGGRAGVLHHRLLPPIFFIIELIQPFHDNPLPLLAVRREDIPNVQFAADAAMVANLGKAISRQRSWIRQRDPALLEQPNVGYEAVGDDLLDEVLSGLGIEVCKRASGIVMDDREHRQETGVPRG